MKRLPIQYFVGVTARWGAWLLVLALLIADDAFNRVATDPQPLLLFSYITLYAILWTRQLPRLLGRTGDGSIVLVYDLLLSALPVLLSGAWASPFLPFALSVLVLPAWSRGWRGGLLVAATFLALDQTMLWLGALSTGLSPWEIASSGDEVALGSQSLLSTGSLALVGRTLLPFGVVAAAVGLAEARRQVAERRQRRSRRVTPTIHWEHAPPRELLNRPSEQASFRAAAGDAPQLDRGWSKERAGQPTLERRSSTSIQGALRQIQPELEAAGVTLSIRREGDERRMSPQAQHLCIKAIETALDNVLCHAHAHNVTLELLVDADATLRILDDGIGLYDGTAEPPGFHQVKRLRFRAQELGGRLAVEERDTGGVRFELRVPLDT